MKKEEISTNSLAHSKWNCKYHIVFAPKYRRKVFYEDKRLEIREILRKLCEWKGVEIVEGEVCPDHIHMLVSIPPKMSVSGLEAVFKNRKSFEWKSRDIIKLSILRTAVQNSSFLASSRISNLTAMVRGLTACTVTNQLGHTFVVFKGTGKGEWIDNGEGLSGIPEDNTYNLYGKNGVVLFGKRVNKDYATEQQVEALNWFNMATARNRWSNNIPITVCGHSKGGNKAQFITLHSEPVDECFSFDGQGFSPEAMQSLRRKFGDSFENRRSDGTRLWEL